MRVFRIKHARHIDRLPEAVGAGQWDVANSMPAKRVLIVEDQFLISEFLNVWIDAFGHDVVGIAATCEAAIEQALAHRPDLILMDIQLEGVRTGIDAALAILESYPARIVYVTAASDSAKLKRLGVASPEILPKPVDPEALRHVLEDC